MKSVERARVAKDLASGLQGFVAKGPLVIRKPLVHSLIGLYIEDSAADPRVFFVWAFFLPLYVPVRHLGFNFGMRIRRKDGGDRWNADDTSAVGHLLEGVQEQATPWFDRLGSASAVANSGMAFSADSDPYVQQVIAYTWARCGDAGRASRELRRLRSMLDPKIPWQHEVAERAGALLERLATCPDDVQRQLDAWEVESARHLGLWEMKSQRE